MTWKEDRAAIEAAADRARADHDKMLRDARKTMPLDEYRDMLGKQASLIVSAYTRTKRSAFRRVQQRESRARQLQGQLEQLVAPRAPREPLRQMVYVIGSAGQPIKIGIAGRPEKRLSELQVGHPHKLRLYAVLDPNGRARDVERECHQRLADYRLNGEWFDHDPYDAAELVQSVIAKLT